MSDNTKGTTQMNTTDNRSDQLQARKAEQEARQRSIKWLAGQAVWEDRLGELHRANNGVAPANPQTTRSAA